MKEQLLEAWRVANRVNYLLIENLTEESLGLSLGARGGRTVYQQLVHLHAVRAQWLEVTGKKIDKGPDKDKIDIAGLRAALEASSKVIEELIGESWAKDGKVKGFKRGLIPFISYLIAHEAHHRGNILLTLKQSGIKLPDALKWGIWDWNKI